MSPAEDVIPDMADHAPIILVVEDEVMVRLAAAEHLRENGFTVIEAVSADEARSVLQSGIDVSLVFSDIQMPGGVDGVGLAQWLSVNHPDIPVVLTSGAMTAITIAKAACPAVSEVMAKPYDHDMVTRRFKQVLAQRARLG